MRSRYAFLERVATVLACLCGAASCVYAQSSAESATGSNSSDQVISSQLPNGIAVQASGLHEEILALRDDILRVRIARGGSLPEDASWAVLDQPRHSSVAVTPISSHDSVGFRTHSLVVELDRGTLELTVRDTKGAIIQRDARPIRFDGNAFRIYKSMPIDEHYFGLGDKTGPLDRRDQAFSLWNTDAYRFQESTDPIYKSIPYFMTYRAGSAAGVLLDNTWRTSFDFGKETKNAYSFGAADGPVDYYVFYGPTPKQVVEAYAWLTGTPPLPPLWSLGFHQSRYSYMSQERVLEIANRLRADRIPSDAIYLDIDFQEKNRPFTINSTAFPDFKKMVAELKAKDFHLVTITDLHIANLPASNYRPYASGIAGDHFVKSPDGSVYVGSVWPGPSVFPDFTRQQTRAWWGTLYQGLRQDGVDGFWNDMNEPSIFKTPTKTMPENVLHRIDEPGFKQRTATHAEIHNVYGMENSRATFEGLKVLDPNTRPFVLTRATYAGGQRYGVTWTGDNSSSWNHLRMATPMLENLGLSGFAFSGADVGGFAGSPSTELLTRWLEIAAFYPIDRDHTEKGTADQEPWAGGPKQEAIRRRFIEARYRLMPYLYTLAEEASRTGLPIMRPLFLEYPDAASDHHPLDIDNAASSEFLVGRDLLIAPPPYPDELDSYTVEFPSLGWYDFWSGERVPDPVHSAADISPTAIPEAQPPLTLSVHPELAQLPVYVHAGTILPMAPVVQSTNETPDGPLILRVYQGDPCTGEIYQDDGKSYSYLDGAYLRIKVTCRQTEEGLRIEIGAHEGSYPAWWKRLRIEIYGWRPRSGELEVNGTHNAGQIEQTKTLVSFIVLDNSNGQIIELK